VKKVKKTFEEWGELLKQTGDEEDFQPINIAKLYTAWNNEREKLIGALEGTSERTLADGTFCWCDGSPDNWAEYHKTAHSSWCFNARAVLVEVKGNL